MKSDLAKSVRIDWNLDEFPIIDVMGGRGYSTLDGGLIIFYKCKTVRLINDSWYD